MRKKNFPVFLLCYLVLLTAYVFFWFWVIGQVRSGLVQYEAAQPERIIETMVSKIQTDGASSVFKIHAEPNRFETADKIISRFDAKAKGKECTWEKDMANYSETSPAYYVYADREPIGTVVLREKKAENLLIFLTLTEWDVQSAEPVLAQGTESVDITVPDSCRVKLNGVDLGASELTDRVIIPEQFKYVQEYLTVPELLEYHVDGLSEKPEVEVLNAEGDPMAYEEVYEDGRLTVTVNEFPPTEPDAQLMAQALENAKRYTNFQSADLPGCRESTKPIADMFPADSIYMAQAEQYRREDMWMYSGHHTPTFQNESVTNYVRYSDDLFSCDVYFDKHIVLARPKSADDALRIETFHMRLYYGLFGKDWKILDMQTLTEE